MASTGGPLVPLAGEPAVLDERPPSPAGLSAPNVPQWGGDRLRAADARRLAGPRNRSGWRPLGRRPLAAGKIVYIAENTEWWKTPRTPGGPSVFQPSYGDGYDGSCSGNARPIFCPPLEGDPVNISAVTVAKDGKVWFASGTLFNEPKDYRTESRRSRVT